MPSSEADPGMPQSYPHGPPPSQQHPGLPPHQQRYPPPYGGHPTAGHMQPPPPHGAYHYGGPPPPPGQYGSPPGAPPHPHQWSGGMPPGHPPPPGPPPPMPGQPSPYPPPGQRSHSPERPNNWNGYRGPPPSHNKMSRKPPKSEKDEDQQYWHGQPGAPLPPYGDGPPSGPPPPSYHGGPYGPHGPPPPSGWQGGHPPPPIHTSSAQQPPPHMYGNHWNGATPPRRPHRDQYSSRHEGDVGSYISRGQQSQPDDDCASSSGGGSTKDKGRGSYKCGRCGVPKKGHVCPYQPKLKRRPDEPPPETRNAAVQVEMDEFMTLRRLNIRIQGFPESYATEPYMSDMVVGEPAHSPTSHLPHPMDMSRSSMMPEVEQRMAMDSMNNDSSRHSRSPMRDAAVGDGNLSTNHLESGSV